MKGGGGGQHLVVTGFISILVYGARGGGEGGGGEGQKQEEWQEVLLSPGQLTCSGIVPKRQSSMSVQKAGDLNSVCEDSSEIG